MSVNPYESPRSDHSERSQIRVRWKRLLLYCGSAAAGTAITSLLWHYLIGWQQLVVPTIMPFYAVALALGGGCGALATDIAISAKRAK